MTTTVGINTPDEVYEDVKRLIYQTVNRFINKFGGDFDVFLSAANVGFMVALKKFDKTRSQFHTFLVWVIRNHLQTEANRIRKHKEKMITGNLNPCQDVCKLFNPSVLSGDVKDVAMMSLRLPVDIIDLIGNHGKTPTKIRKMTRERLQKMGWNTNRIQQAFNGIRFALKTGIFRTEKPEYEV